MQEKFLDDESVATECNNNTNHQWRRLYPGMEDEERGVRQLTLSVPRVEAPLQLANRG